VTALFDIETTNLTAAIPRPDFQAIQGQFSSPMLMIYGGVLLVVGLIIGLIYWRGQVERLKKYNFLNEIFELSQGRVYLRRTNIRGGKFHTRNGEEYHFWQAMTNINPAPPGSKSIITPDPVATRGQQYQEEQIAKMGGKKVEPLYKIVKAGRWPWSKQLVSLEGARWSPDIEKAIAPGPKFNKLYWIVIQGQLYTMPVNPRTWVSATGEFHPAFNLVSETEQRWLYSALESIDQDYGPKPSFWDRNKQAILAISVNVSLVIFAIAFYAAIAKFGKGMTELSSALSSLADTLRPLTPFVGQNTPVLPLGG
jgi:hypothetical protein